VIRSLLMGMIAGMRSLTPVAAISLAARRDLLPGNTRIARLVGGRAFSSAAVALAAGELLGDKLPIAPDRIVAAGMAARVLSGAVAGIVLAPREQQRVAAVLSAAAAVGAAYLTFGLRKRAIRRYGQTSTGIVEDALAVAGAYLLVRNRTSIRSHTVE